MLGFVELVDGRRLEVTEIGLVVGGFRLVAGVDGPFAAVDSDGYRVLAADGMLAVRGASRLTYPAVGAGERLEVDFLMEAE